MTIVSETPLPGVGVRSGSRRPRAAGGVIHHRSGRKELTVDDVRDRISREILSLDEQDGRTLAELLGGSQVARELEQLQQRSRGSDRLAPIQEGRRRGRTIGDTQARTRTASRSSRCSRDDVPAPGRSGARRG
jgi:K+/H+ antiporter YhaU regulatory subunit KhtT